MLLRFRSGQVRDEHLRESALRNGEKIHCAHLVVLLVFPPAGQCLALNFNLGRTSAVRQVLDFLTRKCLGQTTGLLVIAFVAKSMGNRVTVVRFIVAKRRRCVGIDERADVAAGLSWGLQGWSAGRGMLRRRCRSQHHRSHRHPSQTSRLVPSSFPARRA